MIPPALHLASASPRRRDLLRSLGLEFTFAGEDLDESRHDGEEASAYVRRLAREKAAAALATRPECAILGSDTAVVLDGAVFGKPESRVDGLAMLAALSGRTHQVLTGVALLCAGVERAVLVESRVTFREIAPAEAAAYWRSGEPRDKAGGYAIQGLGGVFVRRLDGSCSGVVGLPVCETAAMLREIGIEVLSA